MSESKKAQETHFEWLARIAATDRRKFPFHYDEPRSWGERRHWNLLAHLNPRARH